MTTAAELVSDLPDTDGLSLDTDPGGYLTVMRRIGITDGEAGTPVSAFNSSI